MARQKRTYISGWFQSHREMGRQKAEQAQSKHISPRGNYSEERYRWPEMRWELYRQQEVITTMIHGYFKVTVNKI